MLWYYVCASRRIGQACEQGVRIAMDRLNEAVLDEIEAKVLSPDRLEAIIERVAARRADAAPASLRPALERQLAEARARIDRYVRAIGDGLDLAEIRDRLRDAKATATTLEAQLAGLNGTAPVVLDRARLAKRVADWRGILRRGPVVARQILRKILPGVRPLALFPAAD